MKYDITYLKYSLNYENLCYITGSDNEIFCQNFTDGRGPKDHQTPLSSTNGTQHILQQKHKLGFRGDSRFIGMSCTKSTSTTSTAATQDDVVIGLCESGRLYAIPNAQNIHPTPLESFTTWADHVRIPLMISINDFHDLPISCSHMARGCLAPKQFIHQWGSAAYWEFMK